MEVWEVEKSIASERFAHKCGKDIYKDIYISRLYVGLILKRPNGLNFKEAQVQFLYLEKKGKKIHFISRPLQNFKY